MSAQKNNLNRSLDDVMPPSAGLKFGRRGKRVNKSIPEVYVTGQVGLSIMDINAEPPKVDHNKIELVFPAIIDEEAGDTKVMQGLPVADLASTNASVTINIQETHIESTVRFRSRAQANKVLALMFTAFIVCFLLVSYINTPSMEEIGPDPNWRVPK